MGNDADDAVIVRAVVDLARNLGLQSIAEGVEDEATWEQLTELGCGSAQGYLLARPMPADLYFGWMKYRSAEAAVPPMGASDHDGAVAGAV